MARDRPIVERSDLVLACAHLLHTNGQSTHETVQAAERLGNELGLRATIIANWEDLELRATDCTGNRVSFERGTPTGMNMDRLGNVGDRGFCWRPAVHRLQPGCLRSLRPRVLLRWR